MHQYLRTSQIKSYINVPCDSHTEKGIKPFLKWPGGKRWIAKELVGLISRHLTGRYYEPFLGGGAIFFSLHPEQAILSDVNADLINVYNQVRDNLDRILIRLKQIPVNRESYYQIRDNEPECPVLRAVRFLYLNRTAFGGIYRLNREGKFNVPYGGGKRTPAILWRGGLLKSASEALKSAELDISDFEKTIEKSRLGDVVYCDPTYTVAHENNGFIRYNEKNFSWTDQLRLAKAAKRAWKRGVFVVVSNASHKSLCELYTPFLPLQLTRKSLMCPRAAARREVNEYLFILNPDK